MREDIRNVSILLKSRIDGEQTEHSYCGEYCFKDGSHCIAYKDYTGNAITMVGIEARDSAMLLHRVGYITADMFFDPANDTIVKYEAQELAFDFVLKTHGYQFCSDDKSLNIQVEYSLHDCSGETNIQGLQEISINFINK